MIGLLAVLGLVSLGGCGFKDKPVPPQHVVPKPVVDLQVELDEQGATLSWAYPKETVTGGDLDQIDGFALYRAEVPVDSYCKTCPIPYDAPIALPGGGIPPGGSRMATYEVRGLRPGNLYFFKVRSATGWWTESQDSNEVSFLWQTPPATPVGVTAQGGDGKNLVQWQLVGRNGVAMPATVSVQYQVYRGVDGGVLTKIGEPVAATAYADTAVENGHVYTYQVQAAAVYPQGSVWSGRSEMVEARPFDRTPPPVPGRLEGLRTEVGVKVFWEHVAASDVAGYRIYRRSASESRPTLVAEVNLPSNMFVDTTASAAPLFYSVSSIDTQNPANESSRSSEIRIEN